MWYFLYAISSALYTNNMTILIDLIFGVFALTGIGAYIGFMIDKYFHTTPFISIFLGILAIVFGLSRLVIKSNKLAERENKKSN